MKNVLNSVVATALCAVSLCVAAAPRAHAANSVLSAQLQGAPSIGIAGIDGAKNVNPTTVGKQLTTQFTGSQWDVMDDGTIVISKGGKPVTNPIPFSVTYTNSDGSSALFAPHLRGKDGSAADGYFEQSWDDPTTGFADMSLRVPAQGGGSYTIHLYATFAFAGGSGQ